MHPFNKSILHNPLIMQITKDFIFLSLSLFPFSLSLLRNDFICNGTSLFNVYKKCEYKINSFPPQLRKPAWLMYGIKWMQIKMFHKIDGWIELNGKNGRDKSKKSCSVLGRRDEGKGIRKEK